MPAAAAGNDYLAAGRKIAPDHMANRTARLPEIPGHISRAVPRLPKRATGFARGHASRFGYYASSLMKSERRSPIMIAVRLVLAWVTVGIIDASATHKFDIPWTRSR